VSSGWIEEHVIDEEANSAYKVLQMDLLPNMFDILIQMDCKSMFQESCEREAAACRSDKGYMLLMVVPVHKPV